MTTRATELRQAAYPALDGLRCYAVLLVFLVHLLGALLTEYYRIPDDQISVGSPVSGIAALTFLADGHHGVDIFFLISGFLMARIARPGMGWARFVARRWLRIYPAFLASLVVTTAAYVWLYDWPFQLRDFLLNLVFYNAWPGHGIIAYNHVTWSLGYEFAFYLLVPLLAAWRWPGVRGAVAVAMALAALLLLPPPLPRMSGLFAGFALGCVADGGLRKLAARVPVWLVVGAYCALVWVKSLAPLEFRTFHQLLLPIAALLIVCIVFGNNPLNRFFASKPMRVLGQWSYSIYLFHPLVISLVIYDLLDWTGLRPQPLFAVPFICIGAALLTVLVAAASYALFEASYFRRRQPRPDVNVKPSAATDSHVS